MGVGGAESLRGGPRVLKASERERRQQKSLTGIVLTRFTMIGGKREKTCNRAHEGHGDERGDHQGKRKKDRILCISAYTLLPIRSQGSMHTHTLVKELFCRQDTTQQPIHHSLKQRSSKEWIFAIPVQFVGGARRMCMYVYLCTHT